MATGRQANACHIMELHKELRQLRTDAGFTQEQLADLLKIDQSTISGIERGTPTTTKVVMEWVRICKGQISVIPSKSDPWQGIPEAQRAEAVELARLWCIAPEAIQVATLATLRHFSLQT